VYKRLLSYSLGASMKRLIFTAIPILFFTVCLSANTFCINTSDNIHIVKSKLNEASIPFEFAENHHFSIIQKSKNPEKTAERLRKHNPKQLIRFSGNVINSHLAPNKVLFLNCIMHFNQKSDELTSIYQTIDSPQPEILKYYGYFLSTQKKPDEYEETDHTKSNDWKFPPHNEIKSQWLFMRTPSDHHAEKVYDVSLSISFYR